MSEATHDRPRPALRRPASRLWQILLLLPQPPLSFFYLHLVRAERVVPSFLPIIALGALPLASLLLASRRLGGTPAEERPVASEIALVAIAVTELAWTVVSAIAVAFAALRG